MENGSKLNKLLAGWPGGAVMTASELDRRGYYPALLARYKKSGWIKPLGRGAYFRPSERFSKAPFQGALYGLLKDRSKPSFHLGGLSALEVHGNAHFVQAGSSPRAWIFADEKQKLPLWFSRHDWGQDLRFYSGNLFDGDEGLIVQDWLGFEIRISSRERAILEVLSLVPQDHSLDHAGLLMEGLGTLQPHHLQKLLQACRSIKAKRLAVAMADILNHPWLKKINLKRVDLGFGVISVEKGAPTHPRYRISIPKTLRENIPEVGL